MNISEELKQQLIKAQKGELTEAIIYEKLADKMKDEDNKKVLLQIAAEERAHCAKWFHYTKTDVKPNKLKINWFYFIARVFGLTFGLKLLEAGEEGAQVNYNELSKHIPEAKQVALEEEEHETKLLNLINEEKLNYVGSMVLGLNDALVEMTGALAGFTLAVQDNQMVGILGLITGISATFSMAASEYLSSKTEEHDAEETDKSAAKSAVYTGIAYIITVILLVLPYFLISDHLLSLGIMIFTALAIIFIFNFYISVAKDMNFKRRFLEMAFVSIGVAMLSFFIGFIVNTYFGVNV